MAPTWAGPGFFDPGSSSIKRILPRIQRQKFGYRELGQMRALVFEPPPLFLSKTQYSSNITSKIRIVLSQAAACDGNWYSVAFGYDRVLPGTIPLN